MMYDPFEAGDEHNDFTKSERVWLYSVCTLVLIGCLYMLIQLTWS